MKNEDRIKLIKWGCKYAEGFSFHDLPQGKYLEYQDFSWNIEMEPCSNILYPLLLQRSFEGLNKESEYFEIHQTSSAIFVSRNKNRAGRIMKFEFIDFDSIDQVKESALLYIMNQEEWQ